MYFDKVILDWVIFLERFATLCPTQPLKACTHLIEDANSRNALHGWTTITVILEKAEELYFEMLCLQFFCPSRFSFRYPSFDSSFLTCVWLKGFAFIITSACV